MRHCVGEDNPVSAHTQRSRCAVSTTELLVTLGIMSFLVAVSFPILASARRSAALAQCTGNLHSIVIALNNYSTDNQNTFPAPTASAEWEDQLRNYVPRKTFHCPADAELFSALGSSYDWRDTGDPLTTLAGRSTLQSLHSSTAVVYDMLPGWHAKNSLQVGKLDSSVELMDQAALFLELQQAPDRR